jgi:hypothetical protein
MPARELPEDDAFLKPRGTAALPAEAPTGASSRQPSFFGAEAEVG